MEYKLLLFKNYLELTCQKVIKRRAPNSSQFLREICRTLRILQLDLVFIFSIILPFLAISRLFNVSILANLFNFWFADLFFAVEDLLNLSLEGECFCWLPLTHEL